MTGGDWIRRQCMLLSRNTGTPVPFWLSRTVGELCRWIQVNNEIVEAAGKGR